MPTVAIDLRGGAPGTAELVAELRRFEGLRTPAWRAWSRLAGPDAVHALGGRLPALRPCPGVVTLTPATRTADLRAAALVLCPSQWAMAWAAERPGARRDRLRVVPLAPAPGGARPSAPSALRRPPTGDYVLALADDPDALERAWEAAGDAAVPLVVADAGEPAPAVVRGARAVADLRGAVLFGATALTALGAGVPVVAGAGGAAAEAVGEDGAVVDLEDPEAAVAALVQALAGAGDPGARRARAGLFTWQGTAEATVMAYRELW